MLRYLNFIVLLFISVSQVYSQSLDKSDTLKANAFWKEALTYKKAKQIDSCLISMEKASSIFYDLKLWNNYIHSQITYCDLLSYFGKNDSALSVSKILLGFADEKIGQCNTIYYSLRRKIGEYYSILAKYDVALDIYLKGLSGDLKIWGEKNLYVAMDYEDIGRAYFYLGEYYRSSEYFSKYRDLLEALDSSDKDRLASVLNNLGVIYYSLGDYPKALESYQKALKIRISINGENNLEVAKLLGNIGVIYYAKNENEMALEYYIKALDLEKKILPPKDNAISDTYNNIGVSYEAKGDFNKALEYYKKALELRSNIFGEKHPQVAACYNNIGGWYAAKNNSQKNYNTSLEFLFKAYQIRKDVFGENHPDVAATLNSIAGLYYLKHDLQKAFEYQKKELDIKTSLYGNCHPEVALTFKETGEIYLKEGHEESALEYLQKSLCSNSRSFLNMNYDLNPELSSYLNFDTFCAAIKLKAESFYRLSKKKTDKAEAISYIKKSLKNYMQCDSLILLRRRSITLKADKIALAKDASEIYEKAALDCMELFNRTGDSNYKEKAYEYSEKNKFSILLESLSEQGGLKYGGIPDSLLDKENAIKSELNEISGKIQEVSDSVSEMNLRNRLFELNNKYDNLIRYFENNYSKYFNLKYNEKNLKINEIQHLLDKRTAISSYLTGDSTIFNFLITKDSFYVSLIDKPSNLEDTVKYYRECLLSADGSMENNYRETGQYLYSILFPELLKNNRSINNLIIIPDGLLITIPFETLPVCEKKKNRLHNSYLINKYDISYSYSVNLLLRNKSNSQNYTSRIPDKINSGKLLALAPVTFSKTLNNAASNIASNNDSELNSKSINRLYIARDSGYVPSLPATDQEVKMIGELFKKHGLKTDVRVFNQANKNFIKSAYLEDYSIVHFATHSIVNSEIPESSCILLSSDSTDKDTTCRADNKLTTGEIYNLKLKADLLVLSACETALGTIYKGEGIIGLTRAFLFAGAKNQVVSLWPVNDCSTESFMVEFYRNYLIGKSYSESLRNAKLKMIKNKEFSHPFYWSPFILITNN